MPGFTSGPCEAAAPAASAGARDGHSGGSRDSSSRGSRGCSGGGAAGPWKRAGDSGSERRSGEGAVAFASPSIWSSARCSRCLKQRTKSFMLRLPLNSSAKRANSPTSSTLPSSGSPSAAFMASQSRRSSSKLICPLPSRSKRRKTLLAYCCRTTLLARIARTNRLSVGLSGLTPGLSCSDCSGSPAKRGPRAGYAMLASPEDSQLAVAAPARPAASRCRRLSGTPLSAALRRGPRSSAAASRPRTRRANWSWPTPPSHSRSKRAIFRPRSTSLTLGSPSFSFMHSQRRCSSARSIRPLQSLSYSLNWFSANFARRLSESSKART
mmetsp:Transcript_74506/g.195447  ORF Transcript_74506/g.195447 Transcript_74506/m.195447 type:complete len:325 (-) Transcript_74506:164-1138(-)